MKNLVLLLVNIFLLNLIPAFAQNDSSSAEINIINLQVMEARQKKHEELLNNKIENIQLKENKKETTEKISAKVETGGGMTVKLILIAGISAVVFGIVALRRKKTAVKCGGRQLKENIKMMREEKVIRIEDPALKKTRVNISKEDLNYTGKKAAAIARQLNISKGELQLAARLKKTDSINNRVIFN